MAGRSESRKHAVSEEPIRQSRLDEVDKTALLEENEPVAPQPVAGKAGGIKWRFWTKQSESESALEEKIQPSEVIKQSVQPEQPPQSSQPDMSSEQEPKSERRESAVTTLTQAVAATGHGATSALPKTVAYYNLADTETEPPTGWLVCVKGIYQGQVFACKSGRNRIGRNPNCNINLLNDASISREAHALVIYDPKQRVFYLQNGTGDGLVYLNDSMLFEHEHKQLKAYDQVQIGNEEFIFLPLCGERFSWENYIS